MRWKTKHNHSRGDHIWSSAGVTPAYQPSVCPPTSPCFLTEGEPVPFQWDLSIVLAYLSWHHSDLLLILGMNWNTSLLPSWKFHSEPWLLAKSVVCWKFLDLLIFICFPCGPVRPGILRCWKMWLILAFLSSGLYGFREMSRSPLEASENQPVIFQFWNTNKWSDLSLRSHNINVVKWLKFINQIIVFYTSGLIEVP